MDKYPDEFNCRTCGKSLERYGEESRMDSLGNVRCLSCYEPFIPIDDLSRRQARIIDNLTAKVEWFVEEKQKVLRTLNNWKE